jgi:hypothetical protein
MVLHSRPEERLLAGGSASGQGKDWILDGSRAMTVRSHALWAIQRSNDVWAVNRNCLKRSHESCLAYLDDVIVVGCMLQEYLLNLRKAFLRFQEARLKLNLKKCQLFQKDGQYLGHNVTMRNNHWPRDDESHTGIADPRRINTKSDGSWTYAYIT